MSNEHYGGTVTTAGRNLITGLIAGQTIEFTRVVVGSGKMPDDTEPIDMTDLVTPVALATSTVPEVKDNIVYMTVQYRNDMNDGLKEGFWLQEFGIYAKTDDTDEVLLYYATLGDSPQPVSAYSDNRVDIRSYPVSIALLVDADVKLGYNAGAFVTSEEVNELVKSTTSIALKDVIQAHNENPEAHPGLVRAQAEDVQSIITESLTSEENNTLRDTITETVQDIIVEKLSDTESSEDESDLQQAIEQTVQNVFQEMVQSGNAVDKSAVQKMLDDSAGGNITFAELTIPASGWVLDETSNIYTNTVTCDKATVDSMPFVSVYHESASTAAACGLVSGAETTDGAVIFSADSVPDADISAIAVLMREGAVNSGSTYVLPAATTDALGGVKIGSGLTVDSDGVLSVNSGTEQDVTSMFNE